MAKTSLVKVSRERERQNVLEVSKGSKLLVVVAASIFLSGFFVFNTANAASTYNVNNTLYSDNTGCVTLFQCNTIQAAIDAADSGDTINVAAGTHTTTGQIVIDKNLTIIGIGGKPTIQPDADLPVSDNSASGAWWLVNTGITFNLNNVILDGGSVAVRQAVRSHGNTTIDGVDFMNIVSAVQYKGTAI
ncbi:MAG: hypothetical protein WD889_00170, partial [Candidatus Colwellbacteria bacterium]